VDTVSTPCPTTAPVSPSIVEPFVPQDPYTGSDAVVPNYGPLSAPQPLTTAVLPASSTDSITTTSHCATAPSSLADLPFVPNHYAVDEPLVDNTTLPEVHISQLADAPRQAPDACVALQVTSPPSTPPSTRRLATGCDNVPHDGRSSPVSLALHPDSPEQTLAPLDTATFDQILDTIGSDENDEDIIRLREQMFARKREIEEQYKRDLASIVAMKNRARTQSQSLTHPQNVSASVSFDAAVHSTSEDPSRDESDQKQLEKLNKIREAELRALARFTQESAIGRRALSLSGGSRDDSSARFSYSTSVLDSGLCNPMSFEAFQSSKPATRSLVDLGSYMTEAQRGAAVRPPSHNSASNTTTQPL
jgi:hypothetical protein